MLDGTRPPLRYHSFQTLDIPSRPRILASCLYFKMIVKRERGKKKEVRKDRGGKISILK